MPNLGRETIGATAQNFENYMLGNPVTMPEDGNVESITAYIAESSTNNEHEIKGVLYDSSGNVLGETSAAATATTTPSWLTFTFSSPVAVLASTDLVVAVAAGGGSGIVSCYRDTGSSGDGRQASIPAFPTIPNPTTLSQNTYQLSIYLTYTAAALTQSRFRFRNDDGSETTATWAAAEDADISVAALTAKRLRVQVAATGDPSAKSFKLQYRKVGDGTWRDIN